MRTRPFALGWACGLLLLVAASASARHISTQSALSTRVPQSPTGSPVSLDTRPGETPLHAAAAQGTTWLASYTFDSGASCVDEGWVSVDVTAQGGEFWHVDDFVSMGANYQGHVGVIDGSQSLWCGARVSTANPFCGYATLPGYGNSWDQAFCTTNCVDTGPGAVIQFDADWDSEPGYDATTLEMTNCTGATSDDNWVVLAGGINNWDGNLDDTSQFGDTTITIAIPDSLHGAAGDNALKMRLHFVSDGAWSDQDGLWDTDGGIVIDNLSLTSLPTESFESEAVGDHQTLSGNWQSCAPAGYGDFAALFSGFGLVQEDPCTSNITCMWAFLSGSTADYACGGYPGQAAVPYENLDGQYISNEIWSPEIPITGTGVQFEFAFDVYRDLKLDALVFFVWHVRSIVDGCESNWQDRNFVFYGGVDWLHSVNPVGDLIDGAASHVRLALGVVDMCPFWCGVFGTGACHSHSPMFDNVSFYRIESQGPQWSVRDIDLFQDTFASDGTTTGTARIDGAIDLNSYGWNNSTNIHPADSAVVVTSDPENGLAGDPNTGFGAAVYTWVNVAGPTAAGISGGDLTDNTLRWPFIDTTIDMAGRTWYRLRLDTSFTNGPARTGAQPDRFCIDLNDNLFVPGDTVSFVFGAQSAPPLGAYTYWTPFTGTTGDLSQALSNPAECTILPAGGVAHGGDILYVDGMSGRGAQPYFDTAFDQLGIFEQVDRYDIRGPSSNVGNRPGARVIDPLQQILPHYRKIIWNTGDLDNGLIGDGTSNNERSNDALMLLTFLDNLTVPGGVYFNGDNIAQEWPNLTGSAIPLRDTYIQHTLVDANHVDKGFAISPLVIGEPGAMFDHVLGPDTLIAYGGCPGINDFDVLAPTGPSTQEARYNGGVAGQNGAVIAQTTLNPDSVNVGVVLSGFSFHFIRDDDVSGILDRSHHLHDILVYLGNNPPQPTPATPTFTNSVSQNYPNPFNPTTTIDFTVRELAPVKLTIYNVRGQRVRTLVDGRYAPGLTHQVTWDGRNDSGQSVSSGVYFYKLVTKGFAQTKKMVLLK